MDLAVASSHPLTHMLAEIQDRLLLRPKIYRGFPVRRMSCRVSYERFTEIATPQREEQHRCSLVLPMTCSHINRTRK